jgi:superfamily II DNA or RNA helicase/DNA modification methylase
VVVSTRINVREDYAAFLRAKVTPGVRYEGDYAILPTWEQASRDISDALVRHAPHLHEYQRFAVTFAVARQRAALFLECGLGKTSIALAWVEHVRRGKPAMICAPLAALHEFKNERAKFFPDAPLVLLATADVDRWLVNPQGVALVTHHAFTRDRDLSGLGAFVLDESSILKSGDGAIAQSLTRSVRPIPHRLALSATPAPNDPTEYAQHAVFLGYMRSDAEFRARFFVRDGKDWRVKGHAREALPRWLSRFALWMRDPAVYGMPCNALPGGEPELRVVELGAVDHGLALDTDLFGAPAVALNMSQRSTIRNNLYGEGERTARVMELCRGGASIVWAMRNEHADQLERAVRDAGLRVAQIAGTTPDEDRVEIVRAFQAGELDVLVSKPKVIGHGVNLQRAEAMIFAGYDESYEALHQAIRRAHRQGRTGGELRVYVLVAPEERTVLTALRAKGDRWREDSQCQEREFARALAGDLEAYHKGLTMSVTTDTTERLPEARSEHFWLQHGDSIAHMGAIPDLKTIPDESVDLSVFSPPFSSLFTYSSEPEDMGNCSDQDTAEFNIGFWHFARSLLRVMKPGRHVCLHLSQLIAFRARHGRKGIRDFRGDVVRIMEEAGFHYYGEFVISKNPQAVAIRTKTERLQFSQFKRDSLESSPALNDYVLQFRKPGKQVVPVLNDVSNEEWIRWASGIWDDIRESDVLSYQSARGGKDEKHICPLQLTVIERCVRLWTNPGEVVFTPFLGIGSEVYTAIKQRRIGWGVELKGEYYRQAVRNAELAVSEAYHQTDLLAGVA